MRTQVHSQLFPIMASKPQRRYFFFRQPQYYTLANRIFLLQRLACGIRAGMDVEKPVLERTLIFID